MSYINEKKEYFEINGIFETCNSDIKVINENYLYLNKLIESKSLDIILSKIEVYIDSKLCFKCYC